TEFELISVFTAPFRAPRAPRGPGDDCAVLAPVRGQLCVTTDAVVEGVHFTRRHFSYEDIGYKALAVNLSDLASMGARPVWFVCAVGLPRTVEGGAVRAMARGMARLARAHRVALVGGNFTRAPELSLTLTAAGEVPRGAALLRGGGRSGDVLYVSGVLGDARLGLACLGMQRAPHAQARQRRPKPRIQLGLISRRFATACIDISDGLAGDLGHLRKASRAGAEVDLGRLPVSRELRASAGDDAWRWALAGGEDYELLIAVPERRTTAFERACHATRERVTRIGRLTGGSALVFRHPGGRRVRPPRSFDHFAQFDGAVSGS
ncbi:MAG TPA: thiamine-phosphate kinase, partial [Myxococcaceae bacterium]|nr:thiamine-phosphate kinase [Myxococcaceae bacterium]